MSRRNVVLRLFTMMLAAGLVCTTARAEDKGQADLDQATQLKISAESLKDLAEVIRLCESALKAGLDEGNTQFAKGLLTGTLIHRAELVCSEIFDRPTPPQRWPQLRQLALVDLEQAVKTDATQPDAHYLIARLNALPGGDSKRALAALEEAVKLSANDNSLRAKALVLRANLNPDREKRIVDYDAALKLAPRNAEVVRSRGLFLLTENKLDEAIANLRTAAELEPEQTDTLEALGVALLLAKQYDEALKQFDHVIELEPEASEAYSHRGRIHALKQENEAAIRDLDMAVKLAPQALATLLLRARVHQQAGDTKAAMADTETVLRLKPGASEALQLHAVLAAGSGKFSQAIEDLQQLQKAVPDSPELLLQLGMFYSADKQPRKAVETFEAVLTADAKNWMAFRGRADAYLTIGKQAEAISDYEAALKLQPKNSGILNNLAWVLATSPEDKLRNGKRSLELATTACELTEFKEAHILSTLAAAHAELGDFTKAVEWSKKAVELGKDQPQLSKELASYEKGKPWREAELPTGDDSGDDSESEN